MRPKPIFTAALLFCVTCLMTSNRLHAQSGIQAQPQPGKVDQDQFEQLMKQVNATIEANSKRFLVANTHSPWQMFHGILAFGQDFKIKHNNEKISAIQWIATSDPKYDNEPLLVLTPAGANFHSFTRPWAFQGHPGQFLALLTHSNLPPDFKFVASGKEVTILDIIKDTMWTVNSKEEITWVLWGLNHYLRTDSRWNNKTGEPWSIERLVQIENQNVVEKAACGGNHGLFALTRTRDKYLKNSNQPLRGNWLAADYKIKRYIEVARSLQNQDGTFSANFYEGPEFSHDINKRLNSTGHTLEFIAAALPDQRLKEPWVRNAVHVLSKDLLENRSKEVDCGPLYHSLDALIIYRDRIKALNPIPEVALNSNPAKAATEPKIIPAPMIPIPMLDVPGDRKDPGPISALQPANVY